MIDNYLLTAIILSIDGAKLITIVKIIHVTFQYGVTDGNTEHRSDTEIGVP